MKKFTYLLAVAAVFTACNSGNNGYTVTGTVEGAADGDTVYLETVEGRQFVKLDSAVIKDGTFTFKGTQDTAVNRYISYKAEGKDGAAIDFFLENGKIKINLSQENNSATGTANNDAYQEIRAQINGLNKQMMSIYESMSDTTLTDGMMECGVFQEKIRAAISIPNLTVSHCFSSSASEGERSALASGRHKVKRFKGI